MANNKIQIKRTGTSGTRPTTSNIANAELAINVTDGILFSTNGSTIFEIGANTTNSRVSNTLTIGSSTSKGKIQANGSTGTAGQVLTSGGSSDNVYWSTGGAFSNGTAYEWSAVQTFNANVVVNTTNHLLIGNASVNALANQTTILIANSTSSATMNSGTLTIGNSTVYSTVTKNLITVADDDNSLLTEIGTFYVNTTTISAVGITGNAITGTFVILNGSGSLILSNSEIFDYNNSVGTAGQVLVSNGSGGNGVYWSSNLVADTLAVSKTISANGTNGSAGQVLTSSGTSNAYWRTISALTIANGVQLDSGTTYDGSAARTLTVDGANGISVDSSGVNVLGGSTLTVNTLGVHVNTSAVPLKTDNLSVFAATTSDQLRGVISDETGTGGGLVFATGPTITNLTANSTLTANASVGSAGQVLTSGGSGANVYWRTISALTIANGVQLNSGTTYDGSTARTLTVDGANGISVDSSGVNVLGGSTLTVNSSGVHVNTSAVPLKTDNLSVFAATTSDQLRGIISDETGTGGGLVFATSPSLTTPAIGAATGTSLTLTGGGALARAAATQDGIEIRGRSGGTGSWEVILTPTTLTADRTATFPDRTGTVFVSGTSDQLRDLISDETGTGGGLVFATGPTITNLTANSTITANASVGSAGQVLTSGGSGANVYWRTISALTIANGVQLNSGTTYDGSTARTLTVDGANGISVDSSGVNVLGSNGITVTSAGVNVNANTGLVANSTGVHVTRPPVSSETTGLLSSTSANKTINASGGITVNTGVFTAGDIILLYNNTSGNITITANTGVTMRLAGGSTTGNRTVAQRGLASIYFFSSTDVIVGGTGVT